MYIIQLFVFAILNLRQLGVVFFLALVKSVLELRCLELKDHRLEKLLNSVNKSVSKPSYLLGNSLSY